ncbi:hypothetical protein Brsp05_01640 [Brucella sp. NBRC 12953]
MQPPFLFQTPGSGAVTLLTIHPGFADLNLADLGRLNFCRIFFQNCKIRAFTFIQATDDIIHLAVIGSIDGNGTKCRLGRNTLIREKHFTAVIHDTSNSIFDIAQRLNRRDVPIGVERNTQALCQCRRAWIVELRAVWSENLITECLAPPAHMPNKE